MSYILKITSILVLLSVFTACGTREYEMPEEEESPAEEQIQVTQSPWLIDQDEGSEAGYLWDGLNWVGVSDDFITYLQTSLTDNMRTNTFSSFGTTVMGGAVLGLIVKASGSWFLGGPVNSQSSHWFWQQTNKALSSWGQSVVRGGLFSGACYLVLSGARPLPYDGILGHDFTALSSAISLGVMASIASSPIIFHLVRQDWSNPNSLLGKVASHYGRVGQATLKIQRWSNSTNIARGIRYQLAPGIVILGIGSGLGIIIYEVLQDSTDDTPRSP